MTKEVRDFERLCFPGWLPSTDIARLGQVQPRKRPQLNSARPPTGARRVQIYV